MKRIIIVTFVLFYILLGDSGIPVMAEMNVNTDAAKIADELNIDLSDIDNNLTPDVRDFISENNITVDNTDEMINISPKDVFGYIWNEFKSKLISPLKILASLLAVILIASMIEGMGDTIANKSLTRIYGVISVLVSLGIITQPVKECIKSASETLTSGGNFMLGYIPIFTGITASAGNISSAVSYNMLVVLVAETAVQLASNYIMPSLSICMAFGIVEAINPSFNLSGITQAIKKASTFILGFIMTVFIGLLSIQSIIGASADTLGIKAAKFMVSSFVPVIGGSIADVYSTLKSSLGLLRGGVGFFGIAAIFIMVLPPILEILSMRLVFTGGEIIADLFGVSRLKVLLKNTSGILSLIFSLLAVFSVMLIISTAIIMMIGLDIA